MPKATTRAIRVCLHSVMFLFRATIHTRHEGRKKELEPAVFFFLSLRYFFRDEAGCPRQPRLVDEANTHQPNKAGSFAWTSAPHVYPESVASPGCRDTFVLPGKRYVLLLLLLHCRCRGLDGLLPLWRTDVEATVSGCTSRVVVCISLL